jgi:predicted TPR repeat methyltransferase
MNNKILSAKKVKLGLEFDNRVRRYNNAFWQKAHPNWINDKKEIIVDSPVLSLAETAIRSDNPSILVLGFGSGQEIISFRQRYKNVIGVDIEQGFKDNLISQGVPSESLYVGDIARFDYKRNAYDLVSCFDVFNWMPRKDVETSLRKIHLSLKDSGVLVLRWPKGSGLQKKTGLKRYSFHIGEKELQTLLNTHGFKVIEPISLISDNLEDGRVIEKHEVIVRKR